MINWEKRISGNDTIIDLQGLPYYSLKFDKTSKVERIYDTDIFLPIEPADEDCINYGLSEYDQIFRFTHIPEQVRFRDKDFGRDGWTEKELDAFIDAEWNRRRNGVWFWIKNKKTYIPGGLYFKYNYWTPSTGEEFLYRTSDREFFTFWMQMVLDPLTLGVADFKCRQLGDTENAICIMYERGSRIRGGLTTLQSCINEDHIKGTYGRLVHGHKNMIYYFKPMNTGKEDPRSGLNLDYPSKYITHAGVEKNNEKGDLINKSSLESYQYPPLGSQFKFGPSSILRFDGSTGVTTAYCDEFGKPKEMNPEKWIATMVEVVFSSIRGIKRGMLLLTSTVEDISAEALDIARTIYKASDPNKRLKTGSTLNRIVRIFRGVADRGFETIVGDRWGDIDKQAVIDAVTEKYKAMIEAGNRRGAMDFLRKNPRTIEDVFLTANNMSQFHIDNLNAREEYLIEVASPPPAVRGNFKWKDDIKDTEVIWEPNPTGKFLVSRHPEQFGLKSNKKIVGIHAPKPGNTAFFCAGIDPIDQAKTLESDPSKGALVIMRRFDENVDKGDHLHYQFSDEIRGIVKGMPVDGGSNFETNRICCTYMNRPDDPNVFFEDMILATVYYGTDYLPEKNRFSAMHTYVKLRDYDLYIMDKPTDVKNVKGQIEKDGVTATENSLAMCFDYITSYTVNMCNAIDHIDVVQQLLTMNWKNRGEKDLGVAFGWALYASMQQVSRRKALEENNKIIHFTENTV